MEGTFSALNTENPRGIDNKGVDWSSDASQLQI